MSARWSPVSVGIADEYEDEPLGTKQKFWVQNPDDGSFWLFKFAREKDGQTRGEDWAEWLVHHIGSTLGIPTAEILPAECRGRRGIVSRRVMDPELGERLVHGNSLLTEIDPAYDSTVTRRNPRYTVAAVQAALATARAPVAFVGPQGLDAFDVLAGYLMLDALVAGRDRHHENWAVVSGPTGRYLAPSFDHGNALGFQEKATHLKLLNSDTEARARWMTRGRSHHFAGRPDLVGLAHAALAATSQLSRDHWKTSLSDASFDGVRDMVHSIPRSVMSEDAATFALHILTENRERILRDYPVH